MRHQNRFLISLATIPAGFILGVVVALVAQLNPMGIFFVGAAASWIGAYVPMIVGVLSLMRGVDILETLRAGTPPAKNQPRQPESPAWMK